MAHEKKWTTVDKFKTVTMCCEDAYIKINDNICDDLLYFDFSFIELQREANKLNGILCHLWAHIGWTGPVEPPEDREMNEITPPSRHKIRTSALAVWGRARYTSGTEAPHNIESLRLSGKGHVFLWNLKARELEPAISDFPSKQLQAALITAP